MDPRVMARMTNRVPPLPSSPTRGEGPVAPCDAARLKHANLSPFRASLPPSGGGMGWGGTDQAVGTKP
jgi:hypothetical protein